MLFLLRPPGKMRQYLEVRAHQNIILYRTRPPFLRTQHFRPAPRSRPRMRPNALDWGNARQECCRELWSTRSMTCLDATVTKESKIVSTKTREEYRHVDGQEVLFLRLKYS